MFILTILRYVVSGIPSSTLPFPETTKNIHFLIFLNLMITAHVPNCVMFVLLYVQSLMWFFNGFFKQFYCYVFKQFFKICRAALCCSHYLCQFCTLLQCFLPACVSKHAVITDQFLFKCTKSILTVSISSSWESCTILTSTSCTMQSLLLLQTFLKWPIFPHPSYVFPYARHCWGAWIPLQDLHGHL